MFNKFRKTCWLSALLHVCVRQLSASTRPWTGTEQNVIPYPDKSEWHISSFHFIGHDSLSSFSPCLGPRFPMFPAAISVPRSSYCFVWKCFTVQRRQHRHSKACYASEYCHLLTLKPAAMICYFTFQVTFTLGAEVPTKFDSMVSNEIKGNAFHHPACGNCMAQPRYAHLFRSLSLCVASSLLTGVTLLLPQHRFVSYFRIYVFVEIVFNQSDCVNRAAVAVRSIKVCVINNQLFSVTDEGFKKPNQPSSFTSLRSTSECSSTCSMSELETKDDLTKWVNTVCAVLFKQSACIVSWLTLYGLSRKCLHHRVVGKMALSAKRRCMWSLIETAKNGGNTSMLQLARGFAQSVIGQADDVFA